jgi:hypothetical protein
MAGKRWRKPFQDTVRIIETGKFEAIKDALGALGFEVRERNDNPDHCYYFHPQLKGDPHFGYARNLFRPHGKRRDSGRIGHHDASQAKQVVRALMTLAEESMNEEEADSDE